MTGWVSRRQPVVDHTGMVPQVVEDALAEIGGKSLADTARRHTLQNFLDDVCQELAEARAQVVADRAELDRLRGWRARTVEGIQEKQGRVA